MRYVQAQRQQTEEAKGKAEIKKRKAERQNIFYKQLQSFNPLFLIKAPLSQLKVYNYNEPFLNYLSLLSKVRFDVNLLYGSEFTCSFSLF